uniref:Uncharacterized protein n=1 Tax=Octopus bimaculoides TaxID=37653 RepID=A0A0L8GIR6_OCTBM
MTDMSLGRSYGSHCGKVFLHLDVLLSNTPQRNCSVMDPRTTFYSVHFLNIKLSHLIISSSSELRQVQRLRTLLFFEVTDVAVTSLIVSSSHDNQPPST